MALTSTYQDDFNGGMYRGRKAPGNAAYDLLNLLINDEGLPFKRGGSAYKSGANSANALEGLADVYLAGGQRTVFWSETANDVYALDSDDSTVVTVSSGADGWRKFRRGVVFGGLLFMPASKILGGASVDVVAAYGGSRKTADTSGTCAFTNGSTTVTGTATSWLTTVDAGMILQKSSGLGLGVGGVVRSVTSNTSLELVDGWTRDTDAAALGDFYRIRQGPPLFTDGSTDPAYPATAGRRLLIAQGRRVYYTPRDDPWGGVRQTDYHELPQGVLITGADAILDTGLTFTTSGVWAVKGLVLDDVDDFGNIQQSVEQITKDLILWGDSGIAAWNGAIVVPAIDDVCLMTGSGSISTITGARGSQYDGGIRNQYRSYVAAGYQPGLATVHRGHYILPILNGTTLVDVLVCRLDHGFAWTRWSGHSAGAAYARRIGSSTRQPALLGIASKRVTDLTGCFDPTSSNTTDADGTTPTVQVTTRDYPTGQQPGFVQRLRARYELVTASIPDDFNRADGLLGADWTANPWGNTDHEVEIVGNAVAGGTSNTAAWRSWLNSQSFTAPLLIAATITARPAANANTTVSCALGFRQGSSNGYEARVRFEAASDSVVIDRRDGGSATRILASVPLAGRIVAGDHFQFSVATDGTLTVSINGTVIGSVTDTTYFHASEDAQMIVGVLDDQMAAGVRSSIRMDSSLPAVTVEYSSDQDAGTFTALTDKGEQNGGTGWTASDGSLYQWATVGKRRERIRFRLTLTDACVSFVLRTLEMLHRPQGRQ